MQAVPEKPTRARQPRQLDLTSQWGKHETSTAHSQFPTGGVSSPLDQLAKVAFPMTEDKNWFEDPEVKYSVAVADLRKVEREYAEAESRLIEARRRVEIAKVGTAYYRALST